MNHLMRHYTKRGPGRIHGQGRLTKHGDDTVTARKPRPKFPPAILGGWHHGISYMTYAEYDNITRAQLNSNTFRPRSIEQ